MQFDSNEVLASVRYKIANSEVQKWPFSHFHAFDIFPDDFYTQLQQHLPSESEYKSGQSNYNGRKFAPGNAPGELNFLLSEEFLNSVIFAFLPDFKRRYPNDGFIPKMDLRLILDGENYSIGPHTDAKWKVVSLLFYLPDSYSLKDLGTSLYIPKDRSFRCPGGPHHKFEAFTKVHTAPFYPNSCFGFFKTDYSFHGVEPITIPCRRDVLLWNLYDANMMQPPPKQGS